MLFNFVCCWFCFVPPPHTRAQLTMRDVLRELGISSALICECALITHIAIVDPPTIWFSFWASLADDKTRTKIKQTKRSELLKASGNCYDRQNLDYLLNIFKLHNSLSCRISKQHQARVPSCLLKDGVWSDWGLSRAGAACIVLTDCFPRFIPSFRPYASAHTHPCSHRAGK